MNRERFERARAVFDRACELESKFRDDFILEACGDDDELHALVTRLLGQNARVGAALDTPPAAAAAAAKLIRPMEPMPPGKIGPYRIHRIIGQGGMGTVYEAEQSHPRRAVAIKVLRTDLLSPEAARRFEHEARVLARIDHPGIASVYEAGFAEVGHLRCPFIAMELVRGRPFGPELWNERANRRQWLPIFLRVCEAVAHAHSSGVVHRDLKPSNIILREDGQPKLVDFGVAKILESGGDGENMNTASGQVVGTLAYMSPEQLSGDSRRVDTRADVYSLGVMLYELLAGRLPHDFRGRSLPEAARIIREDEPSLLGSVNTACRGDLEIIVAKAMDKQPERRYASAAQLAADLSRHLRDEPIVARRASTWYQLRKFALRHKELAAGVLAAFLMLVAGLAATSWFALSESRHRRAAELSELRALWESYRNAIAAADRAVQLGDAARAQESLASAPESLRCWEWRYLRSIADRSLRTFRRAGSAIRSVAVLPDASILAADESGLVSRLNPRTGETVWETPGQLAGAVTLAVAPDGEYFATVSEDRGLAIWNMEGEQLWKKSMSTQVHSNPFSPDGRSILVVEDGFVRFLDCPTAAELRALKLPVLGADRPTMDPSGRLILGQLGELAVCLDAARGDELWRYPATSGEFSPDASRAWLVSKWIHGITVHEARTGERLAFYADSPLLAIADTGEVFAVRLAGGGVEIRDSLSGLPLSRLVGHAAEVRTAAFFDRDSGLVTGAADATVKVWSISECEESFVIPPSNDAVLAGAVGPDALMAVTCGWGGVKGWDLDSGAELWSVHPARRELHAAAFDWKGDRVAVAGHDGVLLVLSARTGETLQRTDTVGGAVEHLLWRRGTEQLFASLLDGRIVELAADTGAVVGEWFGGGVGAACLAASDTGSLVCAGTRDGSVLLWKNQPGQSPEPLHPDRIRKVDVIPGVAITAAAFDSSGERLVLGSADGSVRILDMSDVTPLFTKQLTGGTTVEAVALSADGSRLFAALDDGSVHVVDARRGDDLLQRRGLGSPRAVFFDQRTDSLFVITRAAKAGIVRFEARLSQHSATRERVARARRVVSNAVERLRIVSDSAGSIAADSSLDEQTREDALRLLHVRGDHPNALNGDAWLIVRDPGRTAEEYQLALRMAQAACRVSPNEAAFLNTLGVAQFRCGALREAISTLGRSTDLQRSNGREPHLSDVIVTAMAYQHLGEFERARELLGHARSAFRLSSATVGPEELSLFSEAERMIGSE